MTEKAREDNKIALGSYVKGMEEKLDQNLLYIDPEELEKAHLSCRLLAFDYVKGAREGIASYPEIASEYDKILGCEIGQYYRNFKTKNESRRVSHIRWASSGAFGCM